MKTSILILAFSVTAFAQACDSSIGDISSERVTSNVATEEDEDGNVTATALAAGETVVVASRNSEATESYVTVPSGALAVDTEIEMGDAGDAADSVLAALSISEQDNAIVQKGTPLYVGPTEDAVELSNPLAITIPLPVETEGADLTTVSGKLVYIYIIYTEDGWKAGVKSLTAANLIGTFVRSDFKGFGYFQIAFFASEVEDREVDYTGAAPGLGD